MSWINFKNRPYINKESNDLLKVMRLVIEEYNKTNNKNIFGKEFFDCFQEFVMRLLCTNFAKYVPYDWEKPQVVEYITYEFVKYFFKNNPVIHTSLAAYIREMCYIKIMAYIQGRCKDPTNMAVSFDEEYLSEQIDSNGNVYSDQGGMFAEQENSYSYISETEILSLKREIRRSILVPVRLILEKETVTNESKDKIKLAMRYVNENVLSWLVLSSLVSNTYYIDKYFKFVDVKIGRRGENEIIIEKINSLLKIFSIKMSNIVRNKF